MGEPMDGTRLTDAGTAQDCDNACKAERIRRIEERRAMMNQARSSRQRSEVLELSKQKAKLHGTSYQGVSCPPRGFRVYENSRVRVTSRVLKKKYLCVLILMRVLFRARLLLNF